LGLFVRWEVTFYLSHVDKQSMPMGGSHNDFSALIMALTPSYMS